MPDRKTILERLRHLAHGPPVAREVQRAFESYCRDLMVWASPWLLFFFLIVVVVWWPSDLWIYADDPHARRLMGIARGAVVAHHTFWLTLGRRTLARDPMLWGSCIAIGEAWFFAALAGLTGDFDTPWPYFLYIWPLVTVALPRPLWDRCVRAGLFSGGAVAAVILTSGSPLDHPDIAPMVSYMTFSTFFCILVGHGAWLLLRENYVQRRLIDSFNQQLEARVAEQTRDLQALSQRLETLRENERAWMAREMHDAVGQELTAARYALDLVRTRIADTDRRLDGAVIDVQDRLAQTHGSVRRILQRLRPRVLDELGLAAALEWLARDTVEPAGLSATIRCAPPDVRLEPQIETALYRVAQEAVSNALRHARAEAIDLSLTVDDTGCTLAIGDDGIGLEAGRAGSDDRAGVGCIGIRERVAALGGSTRWEAPAGGGTRVIAHLPSEATCSTSSSPTTTRSSAPASAP